MQDNKMFTNFTEQTRGFFEPMRRLNSMMLDNMERFTEFQLESMKRYSQLGTERLRDASEIKDADDMRDFGTRQAEVMNELTKQMLEDARAMTELSMQFRSEIEKLFSELGEKVADQAGTAVDQASAAADQAGKAASEPAKAASQASKKSS